MSDVLVMEENLLGARRIHHLAANGAVIIRRSCALEPSRLRCQTRSRTFATWLGVRHPSRVNTLNKADTIGALANRTIRKIITSGRVFHFKGPKCLSERYKNSQSIFQSEQILKLMLLGDPSREAIHNTANTLQFARNGAVGLQRNFPTLYLISRV